MRLRAERSGRAVCFLALLFAAALLVPGAAQAATPVAISPLNGTPDASPDSQISFLGVPASEISSVSVTGSRSGRHSGSLAAYASAPGASFLPTHPFTQGETVKASAVIGPSANAQTVSTVFTVERYAPYRVSLGTPLQRSGHGQEQSFVTQPNLKPPVVTVTANNPGTAPGDIFLTPTNGYGQTGTMILDPAGRLVWFHPVPKADDATDFEVQSYLGQPVLTWWEGEVPGRLGVGFGHDEIVNSAYRLVASVNAGNGYQTDLHEFQITPQGAAYVTAYSLVSADLSPYGGSRNGILQDAIMQEVDIRTGLVMFEWHAYGHVSVADSYSSAPHSAGEPLDYFHINSISPDPWGDGNFILSSRNTWAAYEISGTTGAILWRIGGRHSSFKMGPGTGTAWQHDVRWQPDRTLTIFDNGATPKEHSESRVLRERVDLVHHTVTLISRYTERILSGSQGNNQLLPNGNSFVGWGEAPFLTEFSPAGQVLFNASFPSPGQSYRAYRFPWSGTPASRPALAVKTGAGSSLTLYASWNGATSVSAWRVLAGPSPSSLGEISQVPNAGFETAIPLANPQAVFGVQAIGAEGQVLSSSGAVAR